MLLVSLCLISVSACSSWFGLVPDAKVLPPLKGWVIDEETNQPIEGAIVVIGWYTDNWTQSFCPYLVSTATDADGNYASPGWNEWDQHIRTTRRPPDAYKPGYEDGRPSGTEGVIYLKRSRRTAPERTYFLSRFEGATTCAGGGAGSFNRYVLTRALYEEARQILAAAKPEDRERIENDIYTLRTGAAVDYISRENFASEEEYAKRFDQVYEELGR